MYHKAPQLIKFPVAFKCSVVTEILKLISIMGTSPEQIVNELDPDVQ